MLRRIRLLCLLLIALALPLQGALAARMMTAVPTPAMAHGPHCPHADMGAKSIDKAGCATCGACCLGTALAPAALGLLPPLPVAAMQPRRDEPAGPGRTPEVPERPPRVLLA